MINKLIGANKNYFALAVFTSLVFLFYGNTLQNGFVHDDIQVVLENPYVHDLRYLPKAFMSCPWEQSFGGCERITYYRPLQTVSYLLTWQISSAPWFFHLVNLLYFLAIVFLVFVLAKILTKNFLLALAAALIFLVHPVNTEVVNWISAVPELAYTMFILLSTIYFIRYRKNSTPNKLFLVALFYLLGMLSKEPAALLPAVFVLLDLSFFKMPLRKLFTVEKLMPYFAALISFLIYFFMRRLVLGHFGGVEGNYYGIFSLTERIYAFFNLFAEYIIILIKPYPLLFFHIYEKKADFLTLPFLGYFAVISVFFASFLYFFTTRKGIFSVAFLWIFIFLFPVLVFVSSLGENMFAERYVFSSNVAFSFILALALFWLVERFKLSKIFLAVFLIVIAALSFYTVYARNAVYKNNDTLYEVTLKDNPRAYTIRFNYAVALGMDKQDWEASEREFKVIEGQNPQWADIYRVYNNLGDIYRMRGDLAGALEYYKKSLAAGNLNFSTPNNIGAIYVEKEEYFNALTYFCLASAMDPTAPKPQENVDRLLSLLQETYKADPSLLWQEITSGKSYTQSPEEGLEYIQKSCQKDTCFYMFLSQLEPGEIILPSLILGKTQKNEIITSTPSFNPQSGGIVLEIDPKYSKDALTFIFPTCQGVYYESIAK